LVIPRPKPVTGVFYFTGIDYLSLVFIDLVRTINTLHVMDEYISRSIRNWAF